MKPLRIVDKQLVAYVRLLSCVACGKRPCGEAHHVTTRGAGGGDTVNNLMPTCKQCHSAIHQYGYAKAIERRPGIGVWLQEAGRTDVLERAARRRS